MRILDRFLNWPVNKVIQESEADIDWSENTYIHFKLYEKIKINYEQRLNFYSKN